MNAITAGLRLPLLSFSTYFLVSALGAVLLGALRHMLRRGSFLRRCAEDTELLCISYLLSHLLHLGFTFPSYNLIGDLCELLLTLIPLWLVLMFVREAVEHFSTRR